MAGDPVSWFVVERGWRVVASDGEEVGSVGEVLGEPELDVFNGITVRTGLLGSRRYVPAGLVRSIVEGRVELAVTAAELADVPAEGRPAG